MDKEPDFSKMTEGEVLFRLGVRPTEKDGKVGLDLPGIGFIEASDKKPDVIVTTSDKRCRVKGSQKFRCSQCGCKVWLAPSGQQMLLKYPGTPILCPVCFSKQAEKEGPLK